MPEPPIRVLLVDDEDGLRQSLANWLVREYSYEVEAVSNGLEAIHLLAQSKCFDVVLLDYLLPPPYNGLTLMAEIQHRCSDSETAFIIFTGWGLDPQVGVMALKAGAYRYLAKPFDREEVGILIQSIVEVRRTREKLATTSREKSWLASLLEVSQFINSTLELGKVLELILDVMKHVVVYDSASIQQMTSDGLEIVACRGFPHPERLIGHVFPPTDAYPNYQVWQNQRPRIEHDMQTTYHARNVRGWLGVPLIYRGESIGVITIDSLIPGFYTWNDAQVAMAFANQAATALKNAELYDQAFRRAETLRALLEVEQGLTHNITTQPKILLDKIAHTACRIIDADCAVIYPYLADAGKYDSTNLAAFGLHNPLSHQDKQRLAEGEGVSSLVLREKCVTIYDAADDDPRLLQHKFIKRERIEAFVGIRLDAVEEPVGILFVSHRHPHHWTEEELSLINIFANQAAVAILNTRLFDRTSEKLEQKIEELERTQEKLVATEAVAWIGLFGSSWAHSVIQKTAAVLNYLEVLADYVPPHGPGRELLTKVEEVVRAIQTIPIAQQLPSKPHLTNTLDLDAALTEQVKRWCRTQPHIEVVLDLNCHGFRTHIDYEWLNVALEKLVNNALRAMPEGGQIKITSTPRLGQVEAMIADTGTGLPDRVRPYFLKRQIPPQFTSGSGIGVLIARYIFRTFGGELEILWSERHRGTVLRFVLPATSVTERLNGSIT